MEDYRLIGWLVLRLARPSGIDLRVRDPLYLAAAQGHVTLHTNNGCVPIASGCYDILLKEIV